MKTVYKRLIGLIMSIPGFGLIYLTIINVGFDITLAQIITFKY